MYRNVILLSSSRAQKNTLLVNIRMPLNLVSFFQLYLQNQREEKKKNKLNYLSEN